jgi:SAM-dependent methyltransferase
VDHPRPEPLNSRQRRLWDLHDFGRGRGLEIGPLHNTSIRREHGDVKYLDVFDRDLLLKTYEGHPQVLPELIPEVDFALFDGERVRSIPETVGAEPPFDWVMASHVIEHVPDVIGWLDQIAQVTVDGGRLVLVVPDRRYCFDVHRPGTTVGQMLQAHELGETVPSVRAVYDYKRGHAYTKAPHIWRGQPPGYDMRVFPLETVLKEVEKARAGEYIDAHVWAFTPGTLLEQVIELREIGASEWMVQSYTKTCRNELEFFMVLQRLPRDGDWPAELLAAEPQPEHPMPDWLAEGVELREKKATLQRRLKRRKKQVARLQQEVRQLRKELESVRSSTRWRVGGVVTRPVSGVRRRLGRLRAR